jgi:Tfp pilus assembly protein PilF
VSKPASRERLDEADLLWKSKKKYLLVVTASKTAGINNNLPFTKVDGQRVSRAFAEKGYVPLAILDGEQATRDNFIGELQDIRDDSEDSEESTFVVYYSGHAVKDEQEKDLWLQLYGQTKFGDHHGVSLSDIVGAVRGKKYKGDLVIILDSCYSGQGALTSQLSLKEADKTVIFTSSASYQESYSVRTNSGIEMSAFTYYLLNGLGPDWDLVDGDSDGIILYSDLQTYIENKLLELLQDKGIIGPMQPKLFGQTANIWAAYDPSHVRNWETQPRKTISLQRFLQLQNPEKLIENLASPLPADAHSYLQALLAIKEEKYDQAWPLLEKAEREKKIPLAEIYWTRGYVKLQQNEFAAARDWLERALSGSQQQNVDLLGMTALSNFMVGDWVKAEVLLKQVLSAMGEGKDERGEVVASLFFLTMLNTVLGNKAEADIYLQRLKSIDPKALDDKEEGMSALIPFVEMISAISQDKKGSARLKMEEMRQSVASKGSEMQQLLPLLDMIETALNRNEAEGTNAEVTLAGKLGEWDKALQRRDMSSIIWLLNQLQVLASHSTVTSLQSVQVEGLLNRTVELAHQHKSEKRKLPVQTSSETREIEVEDSEKQSAIESAVLLGGVASIYAVRGDVANAEKLFKEVIALYEEEKLGAVLAVNSTLTLAKLYEDTGRFNDAESVYKRFIIQLREPLGEKSTYEYMIREKLGELYERQERWADAEQSYRALPRISQIGGVPDYVAIDGQEKLATFLLKRGQYKESVTLFEEIVGRLEQNQKNGFLTAEDNLGDDYFIMAQGYYYLAQYPAAEKALKRTAEIYGLSKEPDLLSNLSCLLWQWATARALNKPDDARRFYHNLSKAVESELARPQPRKDLGETLESFTSSFVGLQSYDEAERLLQLALSVQEKVYGPRSPEAAHVWTSLSNISHRRKLYGDSLSYLRKAREIYEQQSPRNLEMLYDVINSTGFVSYQRAEFEQARVHFQEAADMLPQVPEQIRQNSFTEFYLGRIQRKLGQYDAAWTHLKSSLDLDEHAKKPNQLYILSDILELAAVARLRGDRAEADQLLARSEAMLKNITRTEPIARGWARLAHERGLLALADGKDKQAEQLLREAVEKAEKDPEMDPVLFIEDLEDYTLILRKRGKNKEALPAEQRAQEILRTLKK